MDNFVFDVDVRVHILAKEGVEGTVIFEDFTNGLEDMPIQVVNAVSEEGLPDMNYRIGRYAGEQLIEETMNNHFCSGCSCTGMDYVESDVRNGFCAYKSGSKSTLYVLLIVLCDFNFDYKLFRLS